MAGQLARVFEATGCATQTELADFLGIRQSSVACVKINNTVPLKWLLILLRKKGINPDWILTGKSPRFLRAA